MTPQHIISQLLDSDAKYSQNLNLLKKIIITAYLGRLRINGCPPDNKIALGNYLFDEERILFDFTRVSEDKRILFLQWLLESHQKEKEVSFLTQVYVNEDRGFTSEIALTWWNQLFNWFGNRYSEKWKISDFELSFNYQMTGIELCHGKQGILIGFNQFLAPSTGTKYKSSEELHIGPLGNTKRVYITDQLIDQLVDLDLKSVKSVAICKRAHPQAIEVLEPTARLQEMFDYRKMQRFHEEKAWFQRIWYWFISLFIKRSPTRNLNFTDNELNLLYQNETTAIYLRKHSKEILVREKKPEVENLVLCGGGPKIFAHVGVWKALNEAKIRPIRFAGSSAGAIMALMCYLGYSSEEIEGLFKKFRQEHLVQYNISFKGLSDSHSLKTALDFAVVNKVNQIAQKYGMAFPQGKITFRTLEAIKQKYPDCDLGTELIVTATNKRLRKTSYFSARNTPHMEVSEAVTTSSLFPVIYKNRLIEGEAYNDGGVLSNFPTEAFSDDHSTLLESEYGNNLKVLAVQFDNGTERPAIDRIREQVYRENFILNGIYGMITGVSDPASAWESDRMKLRQYAHQTIVPSINVPISGFTVDPQNQAQMILSGYTATRDYLSIRYGSKEETSNVNQELMYSTFSSLGDLLAYCCYRKDYNWFNIVNDLIVHSALSNRAVLMKQSLELKNLYFKQVDKQELRASNLHVTFFENADSEHHNHKHYKFLALYSVFLSLSSDFVIDKNDKITLEKARHALRLHEPFKCLEFLEKISGVRHIVLQTLINLIKEIEAYPSKELYENLRTIQQLLNSDVNLVRGNYFGQWNISIRQGLRVINELKNENHKVASHLCMHLLKGEEPMQTIREEQFYEEWSDEIEEEGSLGMSL
jgi:NTE family protein